METLEPRLDNALSCLRRYQYRYATLGELISVAPAIGEGPPKSVAHDLDPMSAYSLRRQLESAISGSSVAEDVWKNLESKAEESEKLSDLEKTAFLKSVFISAGLHYNRACQPEITLESAEKLSDLSTTQAYFLRCFAYRVQGKYKAAIDQALTAFDVLFGPPPDREGVFLACHAASDIGQMILTLTECDPQSDLLQGFDPQSLPGTVIQAAEWTTEAFVCHKTFFPDDIEMGQHFARVALDAAQRLVLALHEPGNPCRSTDHPERLNAVFNQLRLNMLPGHLPSRPGAVWE